MAWQQLGVGSAWTARIAVALSGWALASCAVDPATELLVVVESELADIATVEAVTLDLAGDPIDTHRFDIASGAVVMPFSFTIAPRTTYRLDVHVRLDALAAGGAAMATRTLRTQMRAGHRLIAVVRFTTSCAPGPSCAQGETCIDGVCAPTWIDPEVLPEHHDAGRPPPREDDADGGSTEPPPRDAGRDGGPPGRPDRDGGGDRDRDAGTPSAIDAYVPPVDAWVDPHACPGPSCACDSSECVCGGATAECIWEGAPATFKCRDGATCSGNGGAESSLRCEGGASCDVVLGDGSDARCDRSTCAVTVGPGSNVECRQESECTITCTGTCTVECDERARRCDVDCEGGDSSSNNGRIDCGE
jgi:hypothetical protein